MSYSESITNSALESNSDISNLINQYFNLNEIKKLIDRTNEKKSC